MVYFLLYGMILMIISFSLYIFSLEINYWHFTRNVILTFDPKSKTIRINTFSREYLIGEGDIQQVDIFTNDNYKLPYVYYRFKLQDGHEFLLTNKTKGILGIFEYFREIPTTYHIRRFPIVR
jgi:hypothetical protein